VAVLNTSIAKLRTASGVCLHLDAMMSTQCWPSNQGLQSFKLAPSLLTTGAHMLTVTAANSSVIIDAAFVHVKPFIRIQHLGLDSLRVHVLGGTIYGPHVLLCAGLDDITRHDSFLGCVVVESSNEVRIFSVSGTSVIPPLCTARRGCGVCLITTKCRRPDGGGGCSFPAPRGWSSPRHSPLPHHSTLCPRIHGASRIQRGRCRGEAVATTRVRVVVPPSRA